MAISIVGFGSDRLRHLQKEKPNYIRVEYRTILISRIGNNVCNEDQ